MALKSPVNNNLRVTGNILELPPSKEISRSLEKKLLLPIVKSASTKKNVQIPLSRSLSTTKTLCPPESIQKKADSSEMIIKEHQIKSYDIYLVHLNFNLF
jgi:hypothetical protein